MSLTPPLPAPNQVQLVGAAPHGATASEGGGTIGRAVCAFQYDADIVAALKQLAPVQRSYSALTKEWPVDLLALPDLLAHLAQLHYVPPARLAALSGVCERLETLLYQPAAAAPVPGPPAAAAVQSTSAAAASAAAPAAGYDLDEISDEALFAVDIDEIVASQSSQPGGQQGGLGDQGSQGSRGCQGGTADSATRAGAGAEDAATGGEEEDDDDEPPEPSAEALRDLDERRTAEGPVLPPTAGMPTAAAAPAAAAASAPTEEPAAATAGAEGAVDVGDDDVIVLRAAPSEIERDAELKAALTELQRLVGRSQAEGAAGSGSIDRSDVGTAKRRKLTAQQKRWAAGERGRGYGDLHDDDLDSDDEKDECNAWVLGLYRARHPYAPHRDAVVPDLPPAGCDCGQPWKRVGGRHVCRYFGYFSCACGKRWTSAYTWKGERQVLVHVCICIGRGACACARARARACGMCTCMSMSMSVSMLVRIVPGYSGVYCMWRGVYCIWRHF